MTFAHDTAIPDRMDFGINPDRITIEDCLDNYKYKNKHVILNDGRVLGWVTES